MTLRKQIACSLFALLLALPMVADATDLRGRLDGQHRYARTPYPIADGIAELYVHEPRGWLLLGRYITGSDGMYYFPNVMPGDYVIRINGRQNYPIRVLDQPYQDLPPILIGY